jgi:hypothetical protein
VTRPIYAGELDRALRMQARYCEMVAEVHGPVDIEVFLTQFWKEEGERDLKSWTERFLPRKRPTPAPTPVRASDEGQS